MEQLMQEMVRRMLARGLDELPENAKAALEKTRVDMVRLPDRIEITFANPGDDPDVERIKDVMLDSLLGPISQIVTLFGCRVNVEQSS